MTATISPILKEEKKPIDFSNPPAVTQQHINWIVIGLMVLVFLLIIIKTVFK